MLKLNKLDILNRKGKRGVSEVVAYVLLIVMAVSIASMVFAWLRQQPKLLDDSDQDCPEGTKILLYGVKYVNASNNQNLKGNLTFDVMNKGLFTVRGYIVRVNNREGENIGAFVLNRTTVNLVPGNFSTYYMEWSGGALYSESGVSSKLDEPLTYLTVQPWVNDSKTGKKVYCKETSSVEL